MRIHSLNEWPPLHEVARRNSKLLLLIVCLATKEISTGGLFLRVEWRDRVHFHFPPIITYEVPPSFTIVAGSGSDMLEDSRWNRWKWREYRLDPSPSLLNLLFSSRSQDRVFGLGLKDWRCGNPISSGLWSKAVGISRFFNLFRLRQREGIFFLFLGC